MTSQSKIAVFCGKGGVGKTSISLAAALSHADRGLKVVVVSSHPLRELAVAVSLDGLTERYPAAAKNLFVVHIDARELLAEVVRQHFPEWVGRAVLDSQIYRGLVEVSPGLKEFYFLARLQALAERKAAAGHPDYDLLFWDAPSTGHFLSTLRAAKSFETYLTGPLASAGAELARFLSNAAQIAVFPVATLEEMAVAETIEMCQSLEREFHLQATALVLNMVSPVVNWTDTDELSRLSQMAQSSTDPALRFAFERGLIERERAREIRDAIRAPSIVVERVRSWSDDLDLLRQIGESLHDLPVTS